MRRIFFIISAAIAATCCKAVQFTVSCDHSNAMYRLGETAVFTVTASERNGRPPKGEAVARLDNFGDRVLHSRKVDLSLEPTFKVEGRRDSPGFLLLRVSMGDSQPTLCGVAFEPGKIRPYAPPPADFDAFWADAVRKYDNEVTAPVKATKVDSSRPGTEMYELEIPAPGGRTVWGYYSVPIDPPKRPMPLSITVPGAGPAVYYENASVRFANLFVNVHYYKPKRGVLPKTPEADAMEKPEADEFSAKYPVAKVRYPYFGIAAGREDYFLYGAILAANRVVDWACAQPGIDTNRVWYTGQSQGGGMGLILTALNKRIRRAVVRVPALAGHLSYKIDGRQPGWPGLVDGQLPKNRAAAEANAPYFDAINFASRIDVPIRFNVGMIDVVCPPHNGYAAYNVCPSCDKAMFPGVGQGHKPDKTIARELSAWLWRQ